MICVNVLRLFRLLEKHHVVNVKYAEAYLIANLTFKHILYIFS